MKNYFLFLICFLGFNAALLAQELKTPRFSKTDIADSKCKVYLPAKSADFEHSKSDDGSDVYTTNVVFDGYTYGVICVKFSESMPNDGLVELLKSYMDFLKGQLGIVNVAGYGEGHTLDSNPNAHGVIDYWEDESGNDFSVKGWIDSEYLAVLYLAGDESYPNYNIVEMFLNGFRFPDKK